jgi:hypothetical protein
MGRIRAARIAGVTLVACFGLGSPARTALADNKNPNFIPLGETESFLGNAGTGRPNDTGAVYYNPAGLVELGEGRISISGSVYLSFSTHYDAALHFDNTDIPFDSSGFVVIPSAYVATRRIGDWIGAVSVLVPDSFQLNNRLPFTTPSTTGNLIQSNSVSELWIGLSAAHKLGEHWSVGVTLFGIQHEEMGTEGFDLTNTSTMAFLTNLVQTDSNVLGLAATLGVSYSPTDWLRFGLRVQTPLLQVYGKESAYQQSHQVTTGAPAQAPGDDESGPANYAMPLDATFGSAVMPASWFALLADVSLQFGATYSTFPSSPAFNETVTLKPTPRFNLGMELKPLPAFPVRLGIYYNPSASGGHPGDPDFFKQDFYGMSGGVGLDTLLKEFKVRTTLGGFYAFSFGEGTPALANGATASVSSRAIGVLLTTGYAF